MIAANLHKEPTGWHWLAATLAAAVLVPQFVLERGSNPYLRAVGIACLALSPVFIFWPFLLLKRYGRPPQDQPYYRATVLVDRGVYSIVRHPQYVGYILLILGFSALSQHPIATILSVCSACVFCVQSINEEAFCENRHVAPLPPSNRLGKLIAGDGQAIIHSVARHRFAVFVQQRHAHASAGADIDVHFQDVTGESQRWCDEAAAFGSAEGELVWRSTDRKGFVVRIGSDQAGLLGWSKWPCTDVGLEVDEIAPGKVATYCGYVTMEFEQAAAKS